MNTHYHRFKTIYSTNTWALQNNALFDKKALTLVLAEEQSAGRGRLHRKWESPPGLNLYATFCLFVPHEMANVGNLPQVLAISCAEMLEKFDLTPALKWPNDILCSRKKIGGILTETKLEGDFRFVAIGIGLNINMPQTLLNEIPKPATSILVETGKEYPISSIEILLEEIFQKNLSLFFEKGFYPFYETFKTRIDMDSSIDFFDNQQIIKATHPKLNPDGTLSLTLPDGTSRSYSYGEIL